MVEEEDIKEGRVGMKKFKAVTKREILEYKARDILNAIYILWRAMGYPLEEIESIQIIKKGGEVR